MKTPTSFKNYWKLGKINARFWKNIKNFCPRQQLFALKKFCMETRLSNIFKSQNVSNLTKVILESSYRVLQIKFKWKTLKEPVYVLKAFKFCFTFDIQIDITLTRRLLFKKKMLTFWIFNKSVIWAKVSHIWKIEV